MKFLGIFLVLNAFKSTFGSISSEKKSVNNDYGMFDYDGLPQRELVNYTITEPPASTDGWYDIICAVDGEKSLDCGSKTGKQSCCEGLVCHEDQYWRCVTPGEISCAGPGTLAKKCGSNWNFAAVECCEGLECDGKFCIDPNKKGDDAQVECAGDGEKSLGCGSKKGKDTCCEGLVCHVDQYWRCVKEENKFCSGPDTLARDCGSDWSSASKSCCPGLECDGKFCRVPEEEGSGPTCAVDGEKSLDCGSKQGKQSCCEGLVCHEDQYWRCVSPEFKTCSGPGTLSKECGSDWKDASAECCEGLNCGSDGFCVPAPPMPTPAGVIVLNTKHPVTGANGAYFYFGKDAWAEVFAPFGSSKNYVPVDCWRDGEIVWTGKVNVRDNDNGIHGWKQWAYRRPGTFEAGDILRKPYWGGNDDVWNDYAY